jgi:PTS system nitrogen regulatory IIA component
MRIVDFLQPEDIVPRLSATTKGELLDELAGVLAKSHAGVDHAELLRVLQERERLGSTGIGYGIAIPHGKMRRVDNILLAFGRSIAGIDFNALDNRPVHLFFVLVAPEDAAGVHLKMLARISRLLKDPTVRKRLLEAPDAAAISAIIREQDCSH